MGEREIQKRDEKMVNKEKDTDVSIQRPRINTYRDLDVYKMAMDGAMRVFQLTKHFPNEEKYSLTDQIRRSSRSVCANIAEAWRKRRYEAAFVSKLSDSETEAAETQVWLELSLCCGYIEKSIFSELDSLYDRVIGKLVRMIDKPAPWIITKGEHQK